jgi:hypothetical protein
MAEHSEHHDRELVLHGTSVFTSASATLPEIAVDLERSGVYDAIRPHVKAIYRDTEAAAIRHLAATPEATIGAQESSVVSRSIAHSI